MLTNPQSEVFSEKYLDWKGNLKSFGRILVGARHNEVVIQHSILMKHYQKIIYNFSPDPL